MGNCLVTKLKGDVQNDNLLKLGELRIKFKSAGNDSELHLGFANGEAVLVNFSEAVHVTDYAYQTDLGNVTSCDSIAYVGVTIPNGSEVTISVSNKYKLCEFIIIGTGADEIELKGFDFTESISHIIISNESCHVTGFGKLQKMAALAATTSYPSLKLFGYNDVFGDISVFADNTVLTGINIQLANTANIYGSIMAFANNLAMDTLFCRQGTLSGNLYELLGAQVSNGRTSGQMDIVLPSTVVIPNPKPENVYYAYFGSSMAGHNPTAEETAQGWCVR